MPFLSLSVTNFRNLHNGTVDLLANEVFFVGENGQGKSNMLEALYYSAYGNSFRTRADAEIITHGCTDFSLRSLFREENGKTDSIAVFLAGGKKKIEKNGKIVADRKEIINTIPCVLFCHDDLDFATGEPERRRFFIDQSLSMYDGLYIDVLRRYKKILRSRNLLLKEQKYDLLDVYDVQLAEAGIEIQRKRKEAVYRFNMIFGELYREVSGLENVSLLYSPSWKQAAVSPASPLDESAAAEKTVTVENALAILAQKREMDKAVGSTMSGPHRDHIRFIRDKKNFIPCASTGQRRLLAILLRVSQANFYAEKTGRKPVLLMDDVLLELDPKKRQKVTALLPEYDQLFCTFLPEEPFERYKKSDTKVYFVEEGYLHE